jgi:hypothetical protein
MAGPGIVETDQKTAMTPQGLQNLDRGLQVVHYLHIPLVVWKSSHWPYPDLTGTSAVQNSGGRAIMNVKVETDVFAPLS